MKRYLLAVLVLIIAISSITSCQKYLDVVPDNVATLDNAFSTRIEAKKYLFTCYSYMPLDGNVASDPAILGADEEWIRKEDVTSYGMANIARGDQNIVHPYGRKWETLYKGLRDCNIFLNNIDRVPDIDKSEKLQWQAEVKFLKAYYHFYLLRMYGPIPLIKNNFPINSGIDQVKRFRSPVDSCFNYIIRLIDEAEPSLPLTIYNPVQEMGRITQPIALSFKAKVMVYAASPLFNGNMQEAALKNKDGTQLFGQAYSKAKWDSAVVACKEAIDICKLAGLELYHYQQDVEQYDLSDTIMTQMSIRNSLCERWNSEIIWANTQAYVSSIQAQMSPHWDFTKAGSLPAKGYFNPPLEIAAMFYTNHGVPITEDKTWDYTNRYSLQTAADSDKLYIRKGYTAAHFSFNRGPRFYADLGFDGGIWYGQGEFDDNDFLELYYLETKQGQTNAYSLHSGTLTGFFIKKLISYKNAFGEGNDYAIEPYAWPKMRLADLYLLYAEALNESEGPSEEAYHYINLVRERAGLPTVQEAWGKYSTNPNKYKTPKGLRKIIHRERMIELAFEGQRYWDLRRWKEAPEVLNAPITGWDVNQKDATAYYRRMVIFNQTFGLKDYFFPIMESTLLKNKHLVQNLGW